MTYFSRFAAALLGLGFALAAYAAPLAFDIPAQPAPAALKAFGKQARVEVIFRSDEMKDVQANAVKGDFEPVQAIERLLAGTGFEARQTAAVNFIVARIKTPATGSVRGTLLLPGGTPAAGVLVTVRDSGQSTETDQNGRFFFNEVAPGSHVLVARAEGYQPLHITDVMVKGGGELVLNREAFHKPAEGLTVLEPFVVRGEAVQQLEKYEVTGTRQKPFEGPNVDLPRSINDVQPYYIFDAKTIDQSGAVSLDDFLKQRLAVNATAMTNASISTFSTDGTASNINLRGLGADKTLILVNGRRRPGLSADTFRTTETQPDLNGIPLSAIERVEILPASASGIYGGSALGGVVNIILKQDYTGGELRVTYDNNFDTDNARRAVSFSYGFPLEDGKTHVSIAAGWKDEDPLSLADRADILRENIARIQANAPNFFNASLNPAFTPNPPPLGSLPNIAPAFGVNSTLTLKNGQPLNAKSTFVPAGTSPTTSAETLAAGLLANAGRVNIEPPPTAQYPTGLFRPFGSPSESRSFSASLRRQMRPDWEIFADFSHNDSRIDTIYTVAPSFFVSAAAPTNPFTSTVRVAFPTTTRNPYIFESRNRSATLGTMVHLPREWVVELDYTYSENWHRQAYSTSFDSALNTDLSSGALNLFVDTLLYPVDLGKYYVPTTGVGESRLHDFALRGAGPLPALPWGQPRLAVGLEHRLSQALTGTEESVYPITPSSSTRITNYPRDATTDAGYLEVAVPLVKSDRWPAMQSLELQLSGRMEHYRQDTGASRITSYYNQTPPFSEITGPSVNNEGLEPYFSEATYRAHNYTAGVKYQPVKQLTLRISRATAFLPPDPSQLSENPGLDTFPPTVSDPRNGGALVEVAQQSGGNPNLKPQNSESFNAGVIWEPVWKPLAGLRLNVEYYRIDQADAITTPSAQLIVDQEELFPGRVVRDASGQITLVNASTINLYKRETEGIDVSVDYSINTDRGRWSFRAMHSTILHLREQYAATQPMYDGVGFPNEGFAAKSKTNGNLTWEWRRWTAGWTTTRFSSYQQFGAPGGPFAANRNPNAFVADYVSGQGSATIPAQMYHDVMVGYAFGSKASANRGRWSAAWSDLTLNVGVRNVFNKVPPLDVYRDSSNFYLSGYGDPRLRSYWVSVRKAF